MKVTTLLVVSHRFAAKKLEPRVRARVGPTEAMEMHRQSHLRNSGKYFAAAVFVPLSVLSVHQKCETSTNSIRTNYE